MLAAAAAAGAAEADDAGSLYIIPNSNSRTSRRMTGIVEGYLPVSTQANFLQSNPANFDSKQKLSQISRN